VFDTFLFAQFVVVVSLFCWFLVLFCETLVLNVVLQHLSRSQMASFSTRMWGDKGGPTNMIYIYIYVCIYLCLYLYIYHELL